MITVTGMFVLPGIVYYTVSCAAINRCVSSFLFGCLLDVHTLDTFSWFYFLVAKGKVWCKPLVSTAPVRTRGAVHLLFCTNTWRYCFFCFSYIHREMLLRLPQPVL